ncbi:MAG TPA: type II and III secretion system protein family protein [Terriglobia bacterium]|nr:type II and III secretion system protein family protein [Terriglobia bacterium]
MRLPVASHHRVNVNRSALLLLVAGALMAAFSTVEILAQGAKSQKQSTSDVPQLTVIASKSIIVNTADPIGRVSVTDQTVADAVVISPQQVLINGKTPGLVSLILWDRNGKTTSYDLVVEADVSLLQRQLEDQFPTENLNVSTAKGAIVLSGNASDPRVVEKSVEIAGAFSTKVVNMLMLPPPPDSEQILLQVKFADVDRIALQQLGVNLFSTGALNTLGQTTTQQFGAPLSNLNLNTVNPPHGPGFTTQQTIQDLLNIFFFRFDLNFGAVIKALQQKNLLQILAEPNLLASNGKEASFLAGGEFPVPVVQSSQNLNSVTIQFKEFGVRLNFTPTILPSGKIRLKVRPEVSALDYTNAVTVSGFFIPALSTRRSETEVELADGQSFAIAGLIDNRVTEIFSKIPAVGDIPVLGKLFQSRSLQKSKTELMVMVTPKLVKPLNPDQVPPLPETPKPFLDPQKFDGKSGKVEGGQPAAQGPQGSTPKG